MSEAEDRKKRALDDYEDASRQISTNNRYISFGLVAITYTLLSSTAPIATALVNVYGVLILLVGAMGCLGVLLDYLHYACAFKAASLAIENAANDHKYQYNKKWPSYVWRIRFYNMRTWVSIAGAVILIILIALTWTRLGTGVDP